MRIFCGKWNLEGVLSKPLCFVATEFEVDGNFYVACFDIVLISFFRSKYISTMDINLEKYLRFVLYFENSEISCAFILAA